MAADRSIVDLARLAAEADHAEGGHRLGANIATLIAWGETVRAEHGACGRLQLAQNEHGGPSAAVCPLHGRIPAPQWHGPA